MIIKHNKVERLVFPFAAIVGKDLAKTALLLHAVEPQLSGVLLSGASGTAKTTLIHGLRALMPELQFVNVPLGVTEDRLFGSIDLQAMAITGQRKLAQGLLASVNHQVLHADHLNRLPPSVVHSILESGKTGYLHLEREGLSVRIPTKFRLYAAYNPEEGQLTAGVLDFFGLYVGLGNEELLQDRIEITRRQLAFEQDPNGFVEQYAQETKRLSLRLQLAQQLVKQVEVPQQMLELAAHVAQEAGSEGHRAEIYLIACARALAAWHEGTTVRDEDIRAAAVWVLPHRMKPITAAQERQEKLQASSSSLSSAQPEMDHGIEEQMASDMDDPQQMQCTALEPEEREGQNGSSDVAPGEDETQFSSSFLDTLQAIGETFVARSLSFEEKKQVARSGAGKRNVTRSSTQQGRYVSFRLPKGRVTDLALDATLRAAAPYQHVRTRAGLAVVIEQEDIRQKVRDKRVGTTLQFVVDASGSMVARKRMEAVKGAILSLLQDAYQKRDRIGMVAFRRGMADVILPLTRSVDLAAKRLRELPTGGKTPLALGIRCGWQQLELARRHDKELIPVLVVVTDGKANEALQSGQSIRETMRECMQLAKAYRATGMHALVLDTEQGFVRLGQAEKLAEAMGAAYFKLEELSDRSIVHAVRQVLH